MDKRERSIALRNYFEKSLFFKSKLLLQSFLLRQKASTCGEGEIDKWLYEDLQGIISCPRPTYLTVIEPVSAE